MLRIATIAILAATGLAMADARDAEVAALFAHLDQGRQPGAAVLVVLKGEVVHRRGYGLANLEQGTPITPDSVFRLASVSKQFAAMAVALLAERGRVDLDAPACRYVPLMSAYPGVTVRHLLQHTSGVPDYYEVIDLAAWEGRGAIPSNADVIAFMAAMDAPRFEPGERHEYSNPGYEVLPLVVEAVTGRAFADFMRDELFRPLGMVNTRVHDHRRPAIERQVTAYAPDGADGWVVDDWDTLNGITGSGSQFSSLEDFIAWDRALYGGGLLSKGLLEGVFARGRLNDGSEFSYGMGWRLDAYRGHRRIAHGGSWVGFRTAISRFPDPGLTIVILSNRADYDPVAVSDQVADIYLSDGP